MASIDSTAACFAQLGKKKIYVKIFHGNVVTIDPKTKCQEQVEVEASSFSELRDANYRIEQLLRGSE